MINIKSQIPKITVITPNLNGEKYLEATIQSVLLQEYPNLEYIIVDGGSADSSVDIIRKYESKLSYWISENDTGQSNAINKGLALATGDIFSWINSDDIYYPGTFFHVAKMFNKYSRKSKFAGIYGLCKVINENEKWVRDHGTITIPFNMNNLLIRNFIPQPSTFVKTEVFRELSGVNENFHYSMDYDFFLRLAQSYRLIGIQAYYSGFRLVCGTKSTLSPEKFLRENQKIFDNISSSVSGDIMSHAKALNNWNLGIINFDCKQFDLAKHFFDIANSVYGLLKYEKERVIQYLLFDNGRLRDESVMEKIIVFFSLTNIINLKELKSRRCVFRLRESKSTECILEYSKHIFGFLSYPWWIFDKGFLRSAYQNLMRKINRKLAQDKPKII